MPKGEQKISEVSRIIRNHPLQTQRSKQNSQLCNQSMLKHLAVQTSSTSGSANSRKNICHTALWPKTMALTLQLCCFLDSNMALSLHKSCPENVQSQVTAGWERGGNPVVRVQDFFFGGGGIKSKKDRRRGRRGLGGKEKNQKSYVAPCPHHNPPTHTNRGTCVYTHTG